MTREAMVVDVSQDWVTACDVQQRFMQGSEPALGALDCGAHCRQMQALGGDCYDFAPLEGERRLALTIGDASGKGLAAALMIANVQSSLRTAAWFMGDDLAAALGVVNRQVHASSLADRYATLFYGVYDAPTRTLRYVNAGHNPPMVLRRDGSARWLESGGAPVGMFADSRYEEKTVELEPGDLIVAYTDGVVEATNPAGEDWGVEGLQKAVRGNAARGANEIVRAVFRAMDEFAEGRQQDDATVVAVRVR